MSNIREEASRELERVQSTLDSAPLRGEAAATFIDAATNSPLGTAINAAHDAMGCPPLENYRDGLRDVVDGKRDTMPEKPDLRKYYMPR